MPTVLPMVFTGSSAKSRSVFFTTLSVVVRGIRLPSSNDFGAPAATFVPAAALAAGSSVVAHAARPNMLTAHSAMHNLFMVISSLEANYFRRDLLRISVYRRTKIVEATILIAPSATMPGADRHTCAETFLYLEIYFATHH
jgi:hypothetical protein